MNLLDFKKIVFRVISAKHQWIITDPYPKDAHKVGAHQAWKDGFEFAWELVEKRLEEIENGIHRK